MIKRLFILFCLCAGFAFNLSAQDIAGDAPKGEVGIDDPSFVPMVKVGKVLHQGDSIPYCEFNNVYIYPQQVFKNDKQKKAYNNLVRNIKKVLPIAKEVNSIIIETYEYMQTPPNEKARQEHSRHLWHNAYGRATVRHASRK